MSDPDWMKLPVVKTAPVTKTEDWKKLPEVNKLTDPAVETTKLYETQKAEEAANRPSDAVIDSIIGDVSGMPKTPTPAMTGTLSQGDTDTFIKPPSAAKMEATHIEASKETPIIPGLSGTSPQGVRSALAGATMNVAPRALALIDDRPYEVALHDMHRLYAEAREDHPGMNLLGGAVSPLPFAKAKLAGKVAVGAAAGYINEWLGVDPEASFTEKHEAGKSGALMGAGMMGLVHVGAPVAGKLLKGALPSRAPKITVATPEFVSNLKESLDLIPTPKKEWKSPGLKTAVMKEGQTIPDTWQRISTSPEAVPAEYVSDLKSMKPFDASVKREGNKFVAVVREINKNGVKIHPVEFTDADGLYKFRQTLLREHPEIQPSVTADAYAQMDDAMKSALHPEGPARERMADGEARREGAANATQNERTPTPAEEAPRVGRPVQEPMMLIEDGENIRSVLPDSDAAKVASLNSRSIVKIDTPEGDRYAMLGGGFDDKNNPIVIPFDAREGIPTIGAVGRVSRADIGPVDDAELIALLKNPNHGKSAPMVGQDAAKNPAWMDLPHDTQVQQPTVNGRTPPPAPPKGPEPMPPAEPPVPPPPGSEEQLRLMSKVGNMNPLVRQLIPASQRAEMDLADHISDFASLKNLEKVKFKINEALERKLKLRKDLGGEQAIKNFRKDVMLAFEGHIPESKLSELYPEEVFVPKLKLLQDAIKLRDSNDAWFRDNGYLAALEDDGITEATFQKYVNREYASQTLPAGEYAKIAERDTLKMDLAVAGFKNWALKSGKELTDTEALAKVHAAMGSKDPSLELFGSKGFGGGSKSTGALKAKQNLPDWYRNLLGENRDGFQAVARTIAKQEYLKNNFLVFEQIAANPKWAKPDSALLPHEVKWPRFPDDPKLYGKAAGLRADPFVYDALVTLPNTKNAADSFMSGWQGFIKTNQMGFPSMRTLANMFMSNIEAGMLSGGVDLTRPIASTKAMIYGNKAMYEFSKNPLANNDWAQFIRDARRIGFDAPGHIGLDLTQQQQRQMADVAERLIGYKKEMTPMGYWKAALEAHKNLAKPGSLAIDWFDRNQKLASAKMIVDDLMRTGNYEREQALREAYRRIAYSNPMFDRLPPLAERMRSGLVGAVNPYSPYAMERTRIWSQLPGRFVRSTNRGDDAGLPFRMAKYAALGGALWGVNRGIKEWNLGGVSNADTEAVIANRRGTLQEKFNPNPWVFPVRGPNGEVMVMDMTQWSAPLSYMQGDQSLSPLARAALNVVRAPVADGVIGDALDASLKQGGIDMGGIESKSPLPGQSNAVALGEYLMKRGAAPRLPQDLYDRVKETGAAGTLGMRRETTPGMLGAMKAGGAPIEGTQSTGKEGFNPAAFNKLKLETKQIADATAILRMAATMRPDKATGPLQALIDVLAKDPTPEKVKIMKAAVQQIKAHGKELGAAMKANRRAKESHKKEQDP